MFKYTRNVHSKTVAIGMSDIIGRKELIERKKAFDK